MHTPLPSGQADIMFCRGQDGNLVQLGAGAYGQVYKAFLNGLHPVAVKVFQTQVCVCVWPWASGHLGCLTPPCKARRARQSATLRHTQLLADATAIANAIAVPPPL